MQTNYPLMVIHFFVAFTIVCISDATVLNEIGRVYIPDSGFTGAENVAVVTDVNRLFAADGIKLGLNVIKFEVSNDYTFVNMTYEETIFFSFEDFLDLTQQNITIDDITSVDYSPKGYLIVCIVPTDYFINNGWLGLVDPISLDLTTLIELDGCFLPDHVTTTKNGNRIIVSCEGEPDDNTSETPTYNPPGSITIIDASNPIPTEWNIQNIKFDDYNTGNSKHSYLPKDIYLPHSNASVAENIEPEYTSCDYEGHFCYITLQENNAVAVLNLDLMEIVAIYTLNSKDYSQYGLDASDTDGMINIQTYVSLYGLRMPDNIKYFQSKTGRKYIVTANEGDSKEFDESRVADLYLNESIFGNTTALQNDTVLGRLKIVNQLGYVLNNNGTKIYNKLYAFSSRDFTIFEVTNTNTIPQLTQVFSSNSDFEYIIADELGEIGFNSNEYNPSFDSRSDDKGPEPESVTVGTCLNGRQYAFIGLERVGGVMVYDITEIDHGIVTFVEYENNRNFSVAVAKDTRPSEDAGDVGPEQMRFIHQHVYGIPLLVVASAESASVTIYAIDCGDEIDHMVISTTKDTNSIMSTTKDNANIYSIKYIHIIVIIIGVMFA